MVFGQFLPYQQILKSSKKPIGNVLVQRHTTLQRTVSKNARCYYYVVFAKSDHGHQRRNKFWRVLIVWVDHHNYVRTAGQGLPVTSLLVCTVTQILLVQKAGDSEGL